ncbi:MAG: hypothetical protein ACW99U_11070 [Candidatus Thorarchaeota archaeon]
MDRFQPFFLFRNTLEVVWSGFKWTVVLPFILLLLTTPVLVIPLFPPDLNEGFPAKNIEEMRFPEGIKYHDRTTMLVSSVANITSEVDVTIHIWAVVELHPLLAYLELSSYSILPKSLS